MTEILSDRPAPTGSSAHDRSGSLAERLTVHGWWGVGWFVTGLVLGADPLGDNSFLTHLATGRLILHGTVPHADPYSYTAHGQAWVVQSWGASTLYAGLEAVFGAWGIRMLVAITTGAVLAMLWHLTRPAKGLVGRIMLMTLAAGMQFSGWSERPQLLALALLAATAVLILDRRSPWWFVAMFAVWVNVHGSFPVGIVAVALLCLPLVVERRMSARRAAATLAAAIAGAVGGALLSPYGVDLLTFPARLLGRSEVLQYINEWRRPEIGESATWFAIGLGVLAVGSVVRRRAWAWLPLVLVFGALAATSNRNLAFASIVLIPAAAPSLAGLGTITTGPGVSWRPAIGPVAIATALVGVMIAVTPDYALDRYPVRALAWMEQHGVAPSSEHRVFTHDFVGNYLEWREGPQGVVFLDDRAELFGKQIVEDYVSMLGDAEHFRSVEWEAVLDRYDADLVLFRTAAGPFEDAIGASDDWTIAYRDPRWFVACRARPT